jgi:hypothetical protein
MKYVVSWATRDNTTEDTVARALQVFSKWSPSPATTFEQFVGRVDGRGGFAVVETDDPTVIAHDLAVFGAFFDMDLHPVLDIVESTRIGNEAVEFRASIS